MRTVILAQLRTHAARLVAATLAIVIAVAFVVATLVLDETARATVLDAAAAQEVGTAVVVTDFEANPAEVVKLRAVEGVAAVAPSWQTSVQAVLPGRTGAGYLAVSSVAESPALQWQHLVTGRLPRGPGELVVGSGLGARVGTGLPIVTGDGGNAPGVRTEAVVTGIVDLGADVTAGVTDQAFSTVAQARAWGATDPVEVRVAAGAGTGPAALAARVSTALAGSGATVRTGEQAAQDRADELLGGATGLTPVLLVFAAVAVVVAGLVIANTFAVLMAQRVRELALLRCVGATTAQVRRGVLAEAAATGLGASLLGAMVGVGLAAGLAALGSRLGSPVPLSRLSVPPRGVAVGVVLGTVVTVLAAAFPARAATRVLPLVALRPADRAPLVSRAGVVGLVLGLVLIVGGVGLLVVGAVSGDVLVALPGGLASFVGVVLLAQRALPPVVAAAGRAVGRSVPARLAVGNATRTPRRTAATATALLIGVTLTTAMVVGAASTRATATAGLRSAYPTDVVVAGTGADLPPSLLGQVRAVRGVSAAAGVLDAMLTGPRGQVRVQGLDAAAMGAVLRSDDQVPLATSNTVVLPANLARDWAVTDGAEVRLRVGDRARTLIATVTGENDLTQPRVTAATLAGLVPDAPVRALWLRLDDGVNTHDVVGRLTDVVGSAAPTAQVAGLAAERAALDALLNTLLLVVTALLGVAVLIAVIGVGNTLALSVIERRQESGLLRALGLSRRQLRAALAWEAVLVAGVAAVLGVGLGTAYGLTGAASVLGALGPLHLALPWTQLVAIVVVATLAGLAASVLPARRAARTSPMAAIAD